MRRIGRLSRGIERGLVACAALGLVAVGWLGWTVSGERTRNSYETFRAAQRLGLDELTPVRVVWFLVPVLAIAAASATAFGLRRLGGALLCISGAVVVAVGAFVWRAPIAIASGPVVAVSTGSLALVLGAATLRAP